MRALRIARTPIPTRAKLPTTGPMGEIIYEELQRTGDTLRTEPGVPRGVRRTGNFKRMQVLGWEKSEYAMQVINESIKRYEDTYLRVGP